MIFFVMWRLQTPVVIYLLLILFVAKSASEHNHKNHNIRRERGAAEEDSHGTKVTRQIEEMLSVHSYELSIRPNNKGFPVRVNVSLMIESITDISEKNMDLTFTLCIQETWTDERLRFYDDTVESIVLPSRLVQQIWIPDLYLVGSKHSFIHKTTVDNTVLRLFRSGKVFYNVKLTTTVACQMNLYNFPLDTENCSLILQSLGYNYKELQLNWSLPEQGKSLFMSEKLVKNMPKFRLLTYQYHSYNVRTNEMQNFADVKVSQLQINFIFRRYLLSVFFQSYFLAMSMVVLAGLGMWVDPQSVPARVAISVTSVLTLSTIITGLKTSLPKVSYLTAMDIYLWICFLFIFSTVLEFCIYNYIMTQRRNRESQRLFKDSDVIVRLLKDFELYPNQNRFRTTSNGVTSDLETLLRYLNSGMTSCHRCESNGGRKRATFRLENPEVIEVYFRLSYFAAFLFFNGVYWNYYIRQTVSA